MFASDFDSQERDFRNKKTAAATIATILVHALIILFLLFSILHTPNPPLEDNAGGMSVNFGTDATGLGDEQPFTYNPGPTPSTAAAPPSQTKEEESVPEKVLTQDNEETNVVAPKPEDKPAHKVNDKAVYKKHPKTSNSTATTPTPVAAAPAPAPQPKPDANAMFSKGAYGKPNNSKGDGTGGPQGDQGKPDGDPNSRNYLGDGDGTGTGNGHGDLKGGAYLKGRKNTALPAPGQCSAQGKVVIAIKVDKTGKVIDATFKRFASTAVDDCNINNALIAARKATFNPDPSAPDVQEGTITYIYKVH